MMKGSVLLDVPTARSVPAVIMGGGVTVSAVPHVGYAFLIPMVRAARLYEQARRAIRYVYAAGLHLLKAPFERTTP